MPMKVPESNQELARAKPLVSERAGLSTAHAVWILMATVLAAVLLLKHAGLYAIVFADEMVFSRHARLLPVADAPVASFLYFQLYSVTNLCGDGFLTCARMLNTICLAASIPFVYGVARHAAGPRTSMALSLLALAAPMSSYAAYFMADAPYFLAIWISIWAALRLNSAADHLAWAGVGALIGIAAQVKPHALFLLPAFAVYAIGLGLAGRRPWRSIAFNSVSLFIAALIFKYGIGIALAGPTRGTALLGWLYSNLAADQAAKMPNYLEMTHKLGLSLLGHGLALSAVAGVGLAVVAASAVTVCKNIVNGQELSEDERVVALCALLLGSLLLITALFTVSVSGVSPLEIASRLHLRYYNFLFPLVIICVAAQLRNVPNSPSRARLVTAIPVGSALVYGTVTALYPFSSNFVDGPELQGFLSTSLSGSVARYLLGLVAFISLTAWVWRVRVGARMFIFGFIPALAFAGHIAITRQQYFSVADSFVKAAQATRAYLPATELDSVAVFGSAPFGIPKTLFYLDAVNAGRVTLPPDGAIDLAKLPPGKRWILAVGNHPLPEAKVEIVIRNADFVLARVK